MSENRSATPAAWADPDDAPELGDAWFEQADQFKGPALVRRGRPRSDNPKQAITLRLDADLLAFYRATGAGWQTRINAELRKAAGL